MCSQKVKGSFLQEIRVPIYIHMQAYMHAYSKLEEVHVKDFPVTKSLLIRVMVNRQEFKCYKVLLCEVMKTSPNHSQVIVYSSCLRLQIRKKFTIVL